MATTTESLIRDRVADVIAALVPSILNLDRFVVFRNEGAGIFSDWCENSPTAAFRRFNVRTVGDTAPPVVSNTDLEQVSVNLLIAVAYPHNHRAGNGNAISRDQIMAVDRLQIERSIGMTGRANFTPPFPDACWLASTVQRAEGLACDYIVINQTMQFYRGYP